MPPAPTGSVAAALGGTQQHNADDGDSKAYCS